MTKAKRIIFWGAYNIHLPRTRLLMAGMKTQHYDVIECRSSMELFSGNIDAWSRWQLLWCICRFVVCMPSLVWRYMRTPVHQAVIIPYPSGIAIVLLWPFAKLRGAKIIYDGFLPLYEMVVEDRKMVTPHSLVGRLLYAVEYLAFRLADYVVTDTDAHSEYLLRSYHLPTEKMATVWVGAESAYFYPLPLKPYDSQAVLQLLFYGHYIPLHGVMVIVEAIDILIKKGARVHLTLIGRGQDYTKIDAALSPSLLAHITRIDKVDYPMLQDYIKQADIGLGIFGATDKASRVIPNKIFQMVASGLPLITQDSKAIRECIAPSDYIRLVSPGDPAVLAETILSMQQCLLQAERPQFSSIDVSEKRIGEQLVVVLDKINV